MAARSANTVPCMMPYITAFFMPRAAGDRPDVVPEGAVNFAFIGQFAETPRDTIFTTEYSMRTGMEAVYTLLDIDRGVPEVWGSAYDVRDLLNATVQLRDGRKITDMRSGAEGKDGAQGSAQGRFRHRRGKTAARIRRDLRRSAGGYQAHTAPQARKARRETVSPLRGALFERKQDPVAYSRPQRALQTPPAGIAKSAPLRYTENSRDTRQMWQYTANLGRMREGIDDGLHAQSRKRRSGGACRCARSICI